MTPQLGLCIQQADLLSKVIAIISVNGANFTAKVIKRYPFKSSGNNLHF